MKVQMGQSKQPSLHRYSQAHALPCELQLHSLNRRFCGICR